MTSRRSQRLSKTTDRRESTSSNQDATATATNFRAMAFGRNYFHCLGGMIPVSAAAAAAESGCESQEDEPEHEESHEDGTRTASSTTTTTTTTTDSKTTTLAEKDIFRQRSRRQRYVCYQSWDDNHQHHHSSNSLASCWNSTNNTSTTDTTITSMSCTAQSTLMLTQSGKLYHTGMLHGRLYETPTPITLTVPLKCVQMAAGRHFLLARLEGGLAVVSFGAGHFGQLGVVVTKRRKRTGSSPKSATEGEDEDDDDTVTDDRSSHSTPITFTHTPVVIERLLPQVTGSPCASVAAGDWHALALTESGKVWAWGANRMGQCGRISNNSSGGAPTIVAPLPVSMECDDRDGTAATSGRRELRVTQISAGRAHSAAIVQGYVDSW